MPRMYNKNNQLPHARLVELLSYNPKTGEFRWRVDRNSYRGKAKAVSLAGTIDRGGYL